MPRLAQVAKNIVLAGVGNVSIMDDTPCKQYSSPSFLITTDAAESEQRCGTAAGGSSIASLHASQQALMTTWPPC